VEKLFDDIRRNDGAVAGIFSLSWVERVFNRGVDLSMRLLFF